MIKFKQYTLFIVVNLLFAIGAVLALKGRFYLRTLGISEIPSYLTLLIVVLSSLMIVASLWVARGLIKRRILIDRAMPSLIIISLLLDCGLIGMLLVLNELL